MLCIQGEGEVLTNFDSHEQLNPAEFQKGLPTDTLILREGPQSDDTPLGRCLCWSRTSGF